MSTQDDHEHETHSIRDPQPEVEPGALSKDIERLVILGMQKYKQASNERLYRLGNGYIPRLDRQRLASHWKEEFIPTLRGPINSLLAMVDLNANAIKEDDFQFEFDLALNIVLEIDEIVVKFRATMTSILACSLWPSKNPEGPTEESESYPLELSTSLPWVMLQEETGHFFSLFDQCFLIGERRRPPVGRFKRPESWLVERNTTQVTAALWFQEIKRFSDLYLDGDFYFVNYTLNRTEYQLYIHQWECVTRETSKLLAQVASDIIDLQDEPDTMTRTTNERAELTSLPSASNQKELVYMATIPIIKLIRLLLRKLFSEYTSDTFLMHQMSTNLLEGVFQFVDFRDQHTNSISFFVMILTYEISLSPDELLGREQPMVPERALFHHLDTCIKGILNILNRHFDHLSTCSNSHLPTIQHARQWCQNWKDLYNLAIHKLLTAYKNLHFEELTRMWIDDDDVVPDDYYGTDID